MNKRFREFNSLAVHTINDYIENYKDKEIEYLYNTLLNKHLSDDKHFSKVFELYHIVNNRMNNKANNIKLQ